MKYLKLFEQDEWWANAKDPYEGIEKPIESIFKVGDRVTVNDISLKCLNQPGRIVYIEKRTTLSGINNDMFLIEFDERFSTMLHDGKDYAKRYEINVPISDKLYYIYGINKLKLIE